MSFKTLFDKATKVSSLSNKSARDIGGEVESVGYHREDIKHEKRFIPNVDYSDPANFARYGSAERYYVDAIDRIYKQYPYDGSLKEKIEWENGSLLIDKYVFEKLYPRTNGHVKMGESYTMITAVDKFYSFDNVNEWILFKGGPHASTVRGTDTLSGDYKATSSLNSVSSL